MNPLDASQQLAVDAVVEGSAQVAEQFDLSVHLDPVFGEERGQDYGD